MTMTTSGSEMRSAWAKSVAAEAEAAWNLTVGLTNGSRQPCDRRVFADLVVELAKTYAGNDADRRFLAIRLEVHRSRVMGRLPNQPSGIPIATRSPLGAWHEVSIPMPVASSASWSLQQIPRWLPKWRESFQLILIDLGPAHLVPSRAIGRLCDTSYLLLGPKPCGSHEWIMQQLAWHHLSGSTISGSIVSTYQEAA